MKTVNGFDFIEKPTVNCPKCGGTGVSIEFIPKDVFATRTGQEAHYTETLSGRDREYLLCQCKTCGYMALTDCEDNGKN